MDGKALTADEFFDRFTKYRLGTLYYAGILALKYKMPILPATMLSLFTLQRDDSECVKVNGVLIPTLDVIVAHADKHLQKVILIAYILS